MAVTDWRFGLAVFLGALALFLILLSLYALIGVRA